MQSGAGDDKTRRKSMHSAQETKDIASPAPGSLTPLFKSLDELLDNCAPFEVVQDSRFWKNVWDLAYESRNQARVARFYWQLVSRLGQDENELLHYDPSLPDFMTPCRWYPSEFAAFSDMYKLAYRRQAQPDFGVLKGGFTLPFKRKIPKKEEQTEEQHEKQNKEQKGIAVSEILTSQCRTMKSATMPLRLLCLDTHGEEISFFFKLGRNENDNIQKDCRCLEFAAACDALWKKKKRDNARCASYCVIPLTPLAGIIECFEGKVITEINIGQERNLRKPRDKLLHGVSNPQKAQLRVAKYFAGMIVTSYLLGLGDRHPENILINTRDMKCGKVANIDYFWILGLRPTSDRLASFLNSSLLIQVASYKDFYWMIHEDYHAGWKLVRAKAIKSFETIAKHSQQVLHNLTIQEARYVNQQLKLGTAAFTSRLDQSYQAEYALKRYVVHFSKIELTLHGICMFGLGTRSIWFPENELYSWLLIVFADLLRLCRIAYDRYTRSTKNDNIGTRMRISTSKMSLGLCASCACHVACREINCWMKVGTRLEYCACFGTCWSSVVVLFDFFAYIVKLLVEYYVGNRLARNLHTDVYVGPSHMYDLAIKIKSMRQSEWLVRGGGPASSQSVQQYLKDPTLSDYLPAKQCEVVAVLGAFKVGKTKLLSALARCLGKNVQWAPLDSPSKQTWAFAVKWIPWKGDVNFAFIDTAGSNNPIPSAGTDIADMKCTQLFTEDIIFANSPKLIYIMNDLTLTAQTELNNLRQKVLSAAKPPQPIYCIHNFRDAVTVEEVETLWVNQVTSIFCGQSQPSDVQYEMCFKTDATSELAEVIHFPYAKEGSPAGKLFNVVTMKSLSRRLELGAKFKPFNPILTFQNAGQELMRNTFFSGGGVLEWHPVDKDAPNPKHDIGTFKLKGDCRLRPKFDVCAEGIVQIDFEPAYDIIKKKLGLIKAKIFRLELPGASKNDLQYYPANEAPKEQKHGEWKIMVADSRSSVKVSISRTGLRPIDNYVKVFDTRLHFGTDYEFVDHYLSDGLLQLECWKCYGGRLPVTDEKSYLSCLRSAATIDDPKPDLKPPPPSPNVPDIFESEPDYKHNSPIVWDDEQRAYDLVLDVDRMRHVRWRLSAYTKNNDVRNYLNSQLSKRVKYPKKAIVICVLGDFKQGKTFVLGHQGELPPGLLGDSLTTHTVGLSFRFVPGSGENCVVLLDSAGSNMPLTAKDRDSAYLDHNATERFLRESALYLADNIQFVMRDYNARAQEALAMLRHTATLINTLRPERKIQFITVIHNWRDTETMDDLNTLWRKQVLEMWTGVTQTGSQDEIYFDVPDGPEGVALRHVRLAKADSEAGLKCNQSTFNLLKSFRVVHGARHFDPIGELLQFAKGKKDGTQVGHFARVYKRDVSALLHWEPASTPTSETLGFFSVHLKPEEKLDLEGTIVHKEFGWMVTGLKLNWECQPILLQHGRHAINCGLYKIELAGLTLKDLHVAPVGTSFQHEMGQQDWVNLEFGRNFFQIQVYRGRSLEVVSPQRPLGHIPMFRINTPEKEIVAWVLVDGMLMIEAWQTGQGDKLDFNKIIIDCTYLKNPNNLLVEARQAQEYQRAAIDRAS